jgi:hypothetical protein
MGGERMRPFKPDASLQTISRGSAPCGAGMYVRFKQHPDPSKLHQDFNPTHSSLRLLVLDRRPSAKALLGELAS